MLTTRKQDLLRSLSPAFTTCEIRSREPDDPGRICGYKSIKIMDLNAGGPTDDLTDERLIERYRAGDENAFATIVNRYRLELFHFLVRFTANRASAEDVFQETFLQVHQSVDSFRTDMRFKPWLFTIAANKARDHLRRSKRRAAAPLSAPMQTGSEDEQRSFLDLMQSDLPRPEDEAAQRETGDRVRQVVADLPDHLREILLLAYFHQFPYKEIAEMLGIPLGTGKSRLHSIQINSRLVN